MIVTAAAMTLSRNHNRIRLHRASFERRCLLMKNSFKYSVSLFFLQAAFWSLILKAGHRSTMLMFGMLFSMSLWFMLSLFIVSKLFCIHKTDVNPPGRLIIFLLPSRDTGT